MTFDSPKSLSIIQNISIYTYTTTLNYDPDKWSYLVESLNRLEHMPTSTPRNALLIMLIFGLRFSELNTQLITIENGKTSIQFFQRKTKRYKTFIMNENTYKNLLLILRQNKLTVDINRQELDKKIYNYLPIIPLIEGLCHKSRTHICRYAIADFLAFNCNTDKQIIQKWLGHYNTETTEGYIEGSKDFFNLLSM